MQEDRTFVLEISRQEDLLKMSLFEPKDSASTLKQYSQHRVDFSGVDKLSQEITAILNKANLREAALIKNLQKAGQTLLDHTLSRSVKEKLRLSPTANLMLAIDEELVNIPWEFLYDGDIFLCLKFNLGRLVRTKSSAAGLYRASSHIFRMLILANPTSDLKYAYQ